jgi:hypothetical protein
MSAAEAADLAKRRGGSEPDNSNQGKSVLEMTSTEYQAARAAAIRGK